MKRNFDLLMQEQMKKVEKGTPLLLHSCCAPCSSACLERLKDVFKITVLYYNPNIDEEAEYEKRKAEQIRFLTETGWADILDCDHDAQAFIRMSKGLENEPERGARCYECYALRLEKTAQVAKENGFLWFGTTLTLSPHKNVDKILKKVGEECTEVIIGGKAGDKKETVYEIADLAYHVMVLMVEMGISVEDVHRELASRHVIDHKVKQEKMT